MSQASSPGRCCWPMSLIRCGDRSAVRTRTAAKRASSRPLVPLRQLTFCHLALASMSSAAVDNTTGMCRLRGRPRPATGQRAGPGCLNRISGSIGGASAGVRPPRGAEEDRSRLDPGCGRQGSNVVVVRCTTRFENAHRTVLREILYRYHPWFGRQVYVHGTVDEAGDVAFRCSLDGSQADRWLEVPAWMFDRTACPEAELLAARPFVSMTTCSAFCASRSGVEGSNAISCPAFWRIQSLSRPDSGRDPCHGRRQCQGADPDTIDNRGRRWICSGAVR